MMEPARPARVLVVADQTAATPALLDALRGRVARSPAVFSIVVPNPAPAEWHPLHPEQHDKLDAAQQELEEALPLIEEVTGRPVRGSVSLRHDAMDVIEETLHDGQFDEIILSSTHHRISGWLHIDLPHRVAHLGLPVTTITADKQPSTKAR